MFVNLFTNASKYSPENTTTKVTTTIIEDQAEIEISDQGRGISEDELQNIFKPYFRIKEKGSSVVEGTGLGLSIVKHIMDAHSGTITVESVIEEGSKFKLYFPLINEEKNINN